MSFTDEDLNLLKASLIPGQPLPVGLSSGLGILSSEYIKALIARLEAAEKVCTDAFNLRNDNHVDCRGGEKCRMGPNVDASLEEWRKAAGK